MNRQYFTYEQIKNKELEEFLEILIKHSHGKGDEYNDIHIKPDDFGVTVEWMQTPWSTEWGGHWQYINDDDDEVVMKWYQFPNNTSGLYSSEEEFEEALKVWLEEHKEERWAKNQYGHWYSQKEQEDWEKYLNEDKENGREEK